MVFLGEAQAPRPGIWVTDGLFCCELRMLHADSPPARNAQGRAVHTGRARRAPLQFRQHDKGLRAVFFRRRVLPGKIWDVIHLPLPVFPPDQGFLGIPGPAGGIAGTAVIEDAPVQGPGIGPVGIGAHALLLPNPPLGGRVLRVIVVAGIDPAAAGGAAVGLEGCKVDQRLAIAVTSRLSPGPPSRYPARRLYIVPYSQFILTMGSGKTPPWR